MEKKYILPILNELIKTAIKTERDTNKFDYGNVSAGKRVRKEMQKIRKIAKRIRVNIQYERYRRRNVKGNPDK